MVFKCSQCEYEVENAIGLKIHVTKVHSTKSKVMCKFCSKPFASRQSLCTHMKKHKIEEETILKDEKKTQVIVHSDSNEDLKEEIKSLKQVILKLEQILINVGPTTVNIQHQTNNNLQINNHFTYLNIDSNRVRDEMTQTMFHRNILIYHEDVIWRSVLYTHYNDSYPDMQNVAFYKHRNGTYSAFRYDQGSSPVKVDAVELVEEIMKLRSCDVKHWLKKYYPNYNPQRCNDTEETSDITQIQAKFKHLEVGTYWKKEVHRVLEGAITETRRVGLITAE